MAMKLLEYVAHHLEHLERALLEAARVARRAVLILDPWYDPSFASQRVALDFDLWLKTIDRRSGMVHNPCASAERLTAPFRALGGWQLDCAHRLVLEELPVDQMERSGRRQLDTITDRSERRELEARLIALLDRARLDGYTQDGALCLSATRAA